MEFHFDEHLEIKIIQAYCTVGCLHNNDNICNDGINELCNLTCTSLRVGCLKPYIAPLL